MSDFRTYTIQEVAERLKLAESSIRAYIRDGKLKAARFGNRVRISEEHLREFFNSHVVQSDDEIDPDEDREDPEDREEK